MPIIDPYETTYGKVINKVRLIKDIQSYIVRSDDSLCYEFVNTGDSKLAIITGYNEEERSLPIFDHPLIIKDVKDNNIVVVDVRKYIKPVKDEQPYTLSDLVKDGAGYKFSILRGLLMADFLNHDYGNLRQVYPAISMSYAAVLATLINGYCTLNPEEIVFVELACAYFVNTLFVDRDDIDDLKQNILARISSFRYSLPVTKTTVQRLLGDTQYLGQDLEGLLGLIKQVLPPEKAELINDSVLVNLLSNAWFGPGGGETLVIGLEHMPTWIATVFVSLDSLTYKRAKLSSILAKYSKSIDSKSFIREIENYIKEKQ